jgi:small multidrug resistance pump
MPLGVAYGVWAAAGVTLIALLGVAVLGERLTPVQVVGVVLVIAGVLALELGRADHA